MLDIGELLERKPRALSGGQRQRVALGRALVREPQAFLMDEPLSNLDAKLRVQTRSEIKHLQKQVGTTTVYVTHDQVEAMTMGDRIAIMSEGVLEQVGEPRSVYEHPANVFVAGFIGSPAMSFARMNTERGDGGLVLSHGGIRLKATGDPGPLPSEVIVGVRPEHAWLWEEGHGLVGPLEGRVEFAEMLGKESMIGVGVSDGVTFVVHAGADSSILVGDGVRFGVEPGRLYLFDPATDAALAVV